MSKEEFRKNLITARETGVTCNDKQVDEILEMSLAACSREIKSVVIMEELAELQKEVSKAIRGENNNLELLEEIADVYICVLMLKKMYDISEDDLDAAVTVKLLREYERRKPADV